LAEWLYEEGIGENRAALIEDGEILGAAIELPDSGPTVGAIVAARLIDERSIRLDDGGEALLARPARGLTQGASLLAEIVRQPLPERGRIKPAKAVIAPEGAAPAPGDGLLARTRSTGQPVRMCLPHEPDRLEAAGWSELLEEARSGDIAFAGGALRLSPTPAMTLFDVDGDPPLGTLAIASARAVARAIRRHGIGGSIGVDFPTLADRADRKAVDSALDSAIPEPFEKTAMNGFGFVQIVRPRLRASLPEQVQADPAGAEARAALRRAERLSPPGPHHHIVSAGALRWLAAHPDCEAELARRTGVAHQFRTAGNG
jgi:ribonuclease G